MNRFTASHRRIVVVCALALAPILAAQQPATSDAQKFYESLIRTPIVPQRDAGDIQEDLNAAGKRMQQTDKAADQAQARIKESEGWLATQKREMDALKDKTNAAKKEKREADKLTLEAQQKQMELVEDYLKKTKSIREAELDVAKAQKDLINSEMKAFRSESDLKDKVDRVKSAAPECACPLG
jgi:chromosome segregation ATPase